MGEAMTRRLLFVTNTLSWGGAESQVIDLATSLKHRGWEVAVATLVARAVRRDVLEAEGVPVFTLGMARGVPDPRAVSRMARLVRRIRPTVVHAHVVHANLLTRIARLVSPMPVLVSSAHSVNEGGRWRELAYRLTDSLTDVTTNVSHAAVERSIDAGAVPAHRIRFMANGIDPERFRRDTVAREGVRRELGIAERFAWLSVGRFDASKDYPNLLAAVARIAGHSARPLVLIAGDGPRRKEIEARVARERLGQVVRFLGIRKDVPALMNAVDAYVMSSAWEGLPIVLLEAAVSGLPIVATDVGGNAQIVLHGESGFLVPAKDGPALGSSMAHLMNLAPEQRAAWGEAGARHVAAVFGLERVVDEWEQLYVELYHSGAA